MKNRDNMFAAFLDKLIKNKKERFNSKYLFKQLKVKNKELLSILTQWIDQLIIQDKVNLIHMGKDKRDETVYMTKDSFFESLKHQLLSLDFLLDENGTYSFLSDISGTQNPNSELLVNKIQQLTCPLVRFDKGSRNAPIMFNLYKIFVPERMINISDLMIEKYTTEKKPFSESEQVKKMMFRGGKKQHQVYSIYHIMLTALSYLLIEKGKLILTKKEVIDSRVYKVFFNSPDFSVFTNLIKKVYPFNPYISGDFISFYPENWLDIDQIKKQSKTDTSNDFIRNNFIFLAKDEIKTLEQLLCLKQLQTKHKAVANEKDIATQKGNEPDSLIKGASKEEIDQKKEKPSKIIANLGNLKKKKTQLSKPLTFLNEIITKENENRNDDFKEIKQKNQEKQNIVPDESMIEQLHHLDKIQKHYLLRILDSTKVESGYYDHAITDEEFKQLIEKISKSNLFLINESNKRYYVKRKHPIEDDSYKTLREKLEESIMNNENKEKDQKLNKTVKSELLKPKDIKKESKNTRDKEPRGSLLDDLLVNDNSESEVKEELKSNPSNDEEEALSINNNEKAKKSEDGFDIDNIDHESFFEISEDHPEKPKLENRPKTINSELQKEEEILNTTFEEDLKENGLDGKIISVLTDNQEKWLKIKMLSEEIGFELRDGLAYKPEIAVFDEGFSHLEPIAKNTGAIIMHIDEFMSRLGLSDNQ